MNPQQPQTKIQLVNTPITANTMLTAWQVRVSLWDFFLLYGTMNQSAPDRGHDSEF